MATPAIVRTPPGEDIAGEIRSYLQTCEKPMLAEAGTAPLPLTSETFELIERGAHAFVHAWSEQATLTRRIVGVKTRQRNELVLRTEVFGGRTGTLTLYDAARPTTRNHDRRSNRLDLRERFRRFLRRQFPDARLSDLSTETNLESTLSPNFPRALLRRGTAAWAAIAAPPELPIVDDVLSFGLIWLDYLRRRKPRLSLEGLLLYLPAGLERTTCLRLNFLSGAKWRAWAYAEDGFEAPVDLADYGNLDTSVAPCHGVPPGAIPERLTATLAIPGVETIAAGDGTLRIRVRGLELARVIGDSILKTFRNCRPAPCPESELSALAAEVAGLRSPGAEDRRHPFFMCDPELWLESQVRAHLEELDAQLLPAPVYGQVPGITGTAHGLIDLLACDRTGRLAVIELKASEDLHLPLQALDYWMRVKWHAERGDFCRRGYFPGHEIRAEAPRLLLVAPALQFHPTNEAILRYFPPQIAVERIGVGIEWQRKLKVMLRASNAAQLPSPRP